MRPGEFIHYIDVKGKAHNAQVNVVRADSECEQSTIDLTYTDPLGKSVKAFDVLHFSHPRKQDTNPAMPTVHLHCWKGLEEQHNEPAPDHPLYDHPHIHPVGQDEQGNPVPKQRPVYESAVAQHQDVFRQQFYERLIAEGVPEDEARDRTACVLVFQHESKVAKPLIDWGQFAMQPAAAIVEEPHHPGNPETIHYPFECDCCGKDIIRLATHHGGKQFEKEPAVDPSTGTPTAEWIEHVCNPDDMKAKAEKAQQPKMEAHRDWCGSQTGKPCDCRQVVITVEHPQEGVAPAEKSSE